MEAQDRDAVVYPDSDGEPMADNTLQFEWIVTLKENLDAVMPCFVGGDLLWYPVQGDPKERRAPDVLVALGRPKGHRGSYKQWEEGGESPDVVMEVLSPKNTLPEMIAKLRFYERHGAREFYVVDPDNELLQVWIRGDGDDLSLIETNGSFTSPALGITFVLKDGLSVRHADGSPFLTFGQLKAQRDTLAAERDAAAAERDAAAAERDAAAAERDAAAAERDAAAAERERLADRLRALGIDPDEV